MFCSGCGKSLPNGSTFCSKCGKQLFTNTVSNGNVPQMSANKGLKNAVNGSVYSIDGVRGKHIDIYENKCTIKTKVTLGSIIASNATDGEKTIYYRDCVGVQFKPSGFTIGYLQFETASAMMNNNGSNFFGENSFTFDTTVISNERSSKLRSQKN